MMENDAKFRTSSKPYRVNSKFNAPIARDRQGNYKWASGTVVATCFNSDFFLEEADEWREEAWDLIRQRPDLDFFIITKRVHRIHKCLPKDWGDGWDNVIINATVENQKRADERLPVFLNLPVKKKGLAIAPILEEIHLERYLETGEIVTVSVGGESSEQARVCHFDWVKSIWEQCKQFGVNFNFHQTGTYFEKDGKRYCISHEKEYEQAEKACRLLKGEK